MQKSLLMMLTRNAVDLKYESADQSTEVPSEDSSESEDMEEF